MHCTIYTDGGSLNNPGEAAYAYVISIAGKEVIKQGERMGIATNNIAEYTGLIKALEKIRELKTHHTIDHITVYADSQLLVRQLNGEYRVKDSFLQEKVFLIRALESELNIPISYIHVMREKNTLADSLVKKALGR